MGCDLNSFTFLHYIEQNFNVDYRFFKEFSGNIQTNNGLKFCKVSYFVRDLGRETNINATLLRARLLSNKKLNIQPVGRVALFMARALDLMDESEELISKNPHALIDEGVKFK